MVSAAIILLFVGFSLASVLGQIYLQKLMQKHFAELDTSLLSALLGFIAVQLLMRIYNSVARGLSTWENYYTDTEFNDQLIVKSWVFQLGI